MKAYFFSDTHIRDENDARARAFLDALARVTQDSDTERVILLGDILDVCTGMRGGWRRRYPRFFEILKATRCPVTYCEGNHDFHMAPVFAAVGASRVDCVPDCATIPMGGRRVFVAHGDCFTLWDRSYQWVRSFFRSTLGRAACAWTPIFVIAAVGRLVSVYSRTPRPERIAPRVRLQIKLARKIDSLLERYDAVFIGHTHVQKLETRPDGRVYGNCGYWAKDFTCIEFDPDAWTARLTQISRTNV